MIEKHKIFLTGVILIFGIFLFLQGKSAGEKELNTLWKPDGLKCELMDEPYGIDTLNPAFSWYVNNPEKGSTQKRYQIEIAQSQKDLTEGRTLINTGWCDSTENTYVKISGIETILEENTLYCWRVRLMNEDEKISEYSQIKYFSTKVGEEWNSTDGIWNSELSDYAFLRTTFEMNTTKKIEKALLSVTALSPEETRQYVYNLYLNGTYIGSGPARLNGDEVNYNTYDVTEYLKDKNVLGAICYSNLNQTFLCQTTLFYEDGTKEIVQNSGEDKAAWKTISGDSAYGKNDSMIGTSYYIANAENIDATCYPKKWQEYRYDDSMWKEVVVSANLETEKLKPYQTENMERYYVEPAKVEYKGDGHYFVDMGKEIVGGVAMNAISLNLNPTEVTFRFGEELEEDGTVKYIMRTANLYEEKWTLTCGVQKFENIGMKTFRYIDIYCKNVLFTQNAIKGVEIRQPFDETESFFESSSSLLNEIYDMTKYSIRETNQNLYVDSQSRERGAYEGDVWINMIASYAFSDSYTLARVSSEYLYGNRTWPAEYPLYAIMCAWEDYMYTGNIDSLKENYDFLKNHIDSLVIDQTCGLIKNDYDESGYNRPLVDWPETERDDFAYDSAEYNTVVNAVACVAYQDMAKMADALGKNEDKEIFLQSESQIRSAMLLLLYDNEKGAFSDGLTVDYEKIEHYSQHASAYALYAGIYDSQEMKNKVIAKIMESDKIKMSVFGSYFLLQGLYDSDAGDDATKLLLIDDANEQHTWSYMLREEQATISAEAWSSDIKENMTFSHPWGSSPARLIVAGIFGIKPLEPGFGSYEIKLQPGDLSWASIQMPTIKGIIQVGYKLNDDSILEELKVTVPANTTAELLLPRELAEEDMIDLNGTIVKREEAGMYYKVLLSAGTYNFKTK